MIAEIAQWILIPLAIWGVYLNTNKNIKCYYIWLFTNSSWFAVDLYYGIYGQAALMGVYVYLAVRGIYKWSKDDSVRNNKTING